MGFRRILSVIDLVGAAVRRAVRRRFAARKASASLARASDWPAPLATRALRLVWLFVVTRALRDADRRA